MAKFTALLLVPCFAVVLVVAASRRQLAAREAVAAAALVATPAAALVAVSYGLPPDPMRYVEGVRAIYRNINPDFQWYLFGSFHAPGVPYYHVATLAVKASAPLLALGIGSLFLLRRRGAGLLAELCLLLPALLLLLATTQDEFSAGVRRLLPVFPVLAISGSRFLAPSAGARVSAWLAVPAALLLWHAVSSLSSWPHYIPYFNELAGGRDAHPAGALPAADDSAPFQASRPDVRNAAGSADVGRRHADAADD